METTATRTTRVLIVDDEPLLREGVATVLGADDEFELVGEAGDIEKAVPAIRRLHPDVVIVDYRLPGEDGSVLCRLIRDDFPDVRILVLTRHRAERIIMSSFDAGAHGFLVKDADPDGIREALRTVARGEYFVDANISEQVVKRALRSQRPRNPYGLTRQEVRVLELVDRGFRTQAIAEHLGITAETIKTHLKHALRKLGADDRKSAAGIARRHGLFDDVDAL